MRADRKGLGVGELWQRLKERKLVQWAVAYVAFAFALLQGIDVIAQQFGWPESLRRGITLALAVGFCVVLVLAWYHGEKGRQRIGGTELLILALLLAIGGALLWRYARAPAGTVSVANAAHVPTLDAAAIDAALAKIPAQSVAVLPLANESGDPKQQYFSDGLSEELISDLTQVNGLKVIGKYSSFKFRDSKDSPAMIGATLGVANLIEGSVQQSGERIRIVVNLIRAKDGASVWSHSYDQQLKDVFAIQSQIGHAVASALKVKLLGTQSIVSNDKPPNGDVKAYQLMLQGGAIAYRYDNEANFRQGLALVQQALKLEPDYAYAWGVLSGMELTMGTYYLHGDARQQAFAAARRAADRQATLAPDAAATHIRRADILSQLDGDQVGALAEYQRALALTPNSAFAMESLAGQYSTLGRLQASIDLNRKALKTDPLSPVLYVDLGVVLMSQGDLVQAEQALHKAIALQPDNPLAYGQLVMIDVLRGDAAAALRDAAKETNPAFTAFTVALAKQAGGNTPTADAALHEYVTKYGKAQPTFVAFLYAARRQPDAMFTWLQRARLESDPMLAQWLLNNPFLLRYKDDPRFAALCKQLGLPAPGEPLPSALASLPASAATL